MVEYWHGQSIFGPAQDGVCQESCRDLGHVELGFATLVNSAGGAASSLVLAMLQDAGLPTESADDDEAMRLSLKHRNARSLEVTRARGVRSIISAVCALRGTRAGRDARAPADAPSEADG